MQSEFGVQQTISAADFGCMNKNLFVLDDRTTIKTLTWGDFRQHFVYVIVKGKKQIECYRCPGIQDKRLYNKLKASWDAPLRLT